MNSPGFPLGRFTRGRIVEVRPVRSLSNDADDYGNERRDSEKHERAAHGESGCVHSVVLRRRNLIEWRRP